MILSALLEGDNLSANISYGVNIERNDALFTTSIANYPDVAPLTAEPAAFVQSRPIRVSEGETFRCRAHTGDTSWVLEFNQSFFAALYWPA